MFEGFIAGFAYGLTTVAVGQPLDTIKTRMQVLNSSSMVATFRSIWKKDGILGLYRGGAPLVLGGGLMRSAQFGVSSACMKLYDQFVGTEHKNQPKSLYLVFATGIMGGLGRGLIEAPFEYIKVRRQIDSSWKFSEMYKGSGATVLRNCLLFGSFVVYVDVGNRIIPGGMSPFMSGSICATLAWMTVWPLDVLKSRLQSGKYEGQGIAAVFRDIAKNRASLTSGMAPGLIRAAYANGMSMMVYRYVEGVLLSESES